MLNVGLTPLGSVVSKPDVGEKVVKIWRGEKPSAEEIESLIFGNLFHDLVKKYTRYVDVPIFLKNLSVVVRQCLFQEERISEELLLLEKGLENKS